ncbi:MAG: YbhB/YbcL family Raf kinase inhibitor-like protein [Caldilineaceae bacterium]|nr:YbhB/YbcL family Raf kinase inhibitor-like protein [Caldilineaceae bacterium]
MLPFVLESPAFHHGEPIPRAYSCDGRDLSPPLEWKETPQGVRSFALIVDDPDAPRGVWVHWVIFNIPAECSALPEGVSTLPALPDGARNGQNSWRRTGYGGPCPPSGVHRYFFKLYALDTMLDLPSSAGKDELLRAMQGHIIGQAELMGTYAR